MPYQGADERGLVNVAASVTAKCGDINAARMLRLPAGAILAMDRTLYDVIESRSVVPGKNVLPDETIVFSVLKSYEKYPHPLRLITFWDEKKGEMYFLSNNFKLATATTAAIYKECWQIELFLRP